MPDTLKQNTRIHDVVSTSDGGWIVQGDSYGRLWLIDRKTGTFVVDDDVHGRLAALCLTPDERHLVSAGEDGVIAVRTFR